MEALGGLAPLFSGAPDLPRRNRCDWSNPEGGGWLAAGALFFW